MFSAMNPADVVAPSADFTAVCVSPTWLQAYTEPPLSRLSETLSTVNLDVLDGDTVRLPFVVATNFPVYVPFAVIATKVTPPHARVAVPTVRAETSIEY